MVVVIGCVQLTTATNAEAYTVPSGKADDVTRWLYENSPHTPSAPNASCVNVCSELWLEEHRPIPNQPQSRAMWGELAELNKRTSLWSKALPLLSRASLAATAGYVGWQIGTGARKMFVEVDKPYKTAGSPAPWTHFQSVNAGATIAGFSGGNVIAPAYGYVFDNGSVNYATINAATSPCPLVNATPALPNGGAYYLPGVGVSTACYIQPSGPWSTATPTYVVPFSKVTSSAPRVLAGETADMTEAAGTDPGFSTVKSSMLSELDTHPERYPELITWLSSQLDAGSLPNCTGLYSACVDALDTGGWTTHTRTTVTYPEVDVTKPANAVLDTNPNGGATVPFTTSIEIVTNPTTGGMPIAIPEPLDGETASAYQARLVELGLLGSITVLSETLLDPDVGPNAVSRTSPAPTPASSTVLADYAAPGDTITIYANPPTAPVPAGGGSCTAWVSPDLNLSPLSGIDLTNAFPFGIPIFVLDALALFDVTPITPEWDFHFPFAGEGTNWTVDLHMFDDVMPPIRNVLLFSALVAMAWGFWRLATGGPDPTRDVD